MTKPLATRFPSAADDGERLKTVELRLGRQLPSTFASIAVSETWLKLRALGGSTLHMRGPDGLGLPLPDYMAGVSDTDVLPFAIEEQGCCVWALGLTGADDPEVLFAADPRWHWTPVGLRFAEWVIQALADDELVRMATFHIQAQSPDPEQLHVLRTRFRFGRTTKGWPGERHLRAHSDELELLIWDDPSSDYSDWMVRVDGDPERALRSLPRFDRLLTTGYVNGPTDGPAADALDRLRHELSE